MDMTPQRWAATGVYLDAVFGQEDRQLASLMDRAVAADVPDIAVSAAVGRLLWFLARLAGARTIVEVGTLAGYSGIWLARALPETGRLITIEPEPRHAAFARAEFDAAGVGERVEVREGFGLDVLPTLRRELGEGAVDLVFLDAVKTEYPAYLPHATALLRPGGLLVADNALGSGSWWIDTESPEREAVDAFNRAVAHDGGYEACCVPIREGVLIARKV